MIKLVRRTRSDASGIYGHGVRVMSKQESQTLTFPLLASILRTMRQPFVPLGAC